MSFKTILIIALFVFIGIAVCLVLGYFEIYPFSAVYTYVMGLFGSTGLSLESVTMNPTALLTTAGAGITAATAVAVPLYNKLNAAKAQATQIKASADSAYDSLKSEKDKLAAQVSSLQGETKTIEDLKLQASKANDLQTKLASMTSSFESLSQQKTSYQNKAEELAAQLKTAQDQLAVLKPQIK